jgi:hypothetical protein
MGLERRYRKALWQKVVSRDADGSALRKFALVCCVGNFEALSVCP